MGFCLDPSDCYYKLLGYQWVISMPSELLNITEVVVHSGYATARLALVVG